MTWYKEEISDLVSQFPRRLPYLWWRPDLFEVGRNLSLPLELRQEFDVHIGLVATGMGILSRAVNTAQLWVPVDHPHARAVLETELLVSMYVCLLYPRETVIVRLAECLANDSDEGKICRNLADVSQAYRHIRNALAHGTWQFLNLPPPDHELRIRFIDRGWNETLLWREVRLLCLLVLDIVLSAWEWLGVGDTHGRTDG